MRAYLLVLSVALLAGCPELVTADDPRTVDHGGAQAGTCSGAAAWCEDRTQAQCNSGCTIGPACRSPMLDRCANHGQMSTCNADASCKWSSESCVVAVGTACQFFDTASQCTTSSIETCVWGTACIGGPRIDTPTRCFDIEERAACEANVGCTWTE